MDLSQTACNIGQEAHGAGTFGMGGDVADNLAVLESEMRACLARPNLGNGERERCSRWLSLVGPASVALTVPASPADVADLPQELLKELNIPSDKLETQVIALLGTGSAPADLDQILIGLYRRFGVIQKRRFLQNKLWRMVNKQQIYKLKDRKGLYAIEPVKDRGAKKASRAKRAGRKR
jgi:hypothetical protein